MDLETQRYPIGRFSTPEVISREWIDKCIFNIGAFPKRIKTEVENLSDEQLDTRYRPDGWTIRQVVNHCADSHMNALTRFKRTLTEDRPTISPYVEAKWAELPDCKTMPIQPALNTLEGLHERWTVILNSLTGEELGKCFVHPEHNREYRLDEAICLYSWHSNHHLAHITTLKERKGW